MGKSTVLCAHKSRGNSKYMLVARTVALFGKKPSNIYKKKRQEIRSKLRGIV